MKTFILLGVMLASCQLLAQTNATGVSGQFKTSIPPSAYKDDLFKPAAHPNEIPGPFPRITLSGVIPEAIKAKNPLQLISPLAPPEYGYGEQNLSLDISVRHKPGLKFLSIDF